jgi:enterochelin esterase-like enzyme
MGSKHINIQKWLWGAIIASALLFIACQPATTNPSQQTPAATQPPVEVTRKPVPTPTMAESKPELQATPCTGTGQIKRYQLDSQLLNGKLYATVYLPPCYDKDLAGGYPVLYLLHGQYSNDSMWLDMGVEEISDALISSGNSKPYLMVMPYEEFYNRDPENNNFPKALIEEIIPFVESTFNACTKRECRALGGISRGASWAMRIGLQHWDLFAAIGGHSLPTFTGDVEVLPDWLEDIPKDSAPHIYLDIGRFDPEVKSAYAFELVLNQKGIMHEWHLNDGRHNKEYWSAHMQEYLEWYASIWNEIQ